MRFIGVQCTDHPDCHYYRGWFNLNFVMHSDFPSLEARNGTGGAQPAHAAGEAIGHSKCFIGLMADEILWT